MEHATSTRARRLAWLGVAVATFGLATAFVFGRVVRGGFETVVLTERGAGPTSLELVFGDAAGEAVSEGPWRRMLEADHRFTVWATGRNAHALVASPGSFFDAEPCHPAKHVLAFGHPLVTLGLLGLPAELATDDPVAAYNFAMMLLPWIAALAMYWLVVEWTGVPAAGIAAGLLYGFHASKLGNVFHPFYEDTGWTVLGMLFLSRFFARGRTVDGVGAALAYALQIGSSLYTVVTSIVVSAPFALWLAWRYRLRAIRVGPALASIAVFGALAGWLLSPYLALAAARDGAARGTIYASWDSVAPLEPGFALIALLALVGLAWGRGRGVAASAGTRWVLAAVAVACALVATGGNVNARRLAEAAGRDVPLALPNLHAALVAVLPPIATGRAVASADGGTHLALCVLAGLGGAALVRRVAAGPPRRAAAAALVAAAWVGALGAPWVGLTGGVAYDTFAIRPPEETLAFFRALERAGNDGPIAEVPVPPREARVQQDSLRQLVSAYHHRRTSSCYNAYQPPEVADVDAILARLPARDAIAELRDLGFTTIVVHHRLGALDGAWPLRESLSRVAGRRRPPVHLVHAGKTETAFAIERGGRG